MSADNQVHDEQKAKLLSNEQEQHNEQPRVLTEDLQNDLDMRPSSSRVKKVLYWNSKRQEFEMDEKHIQELRDQHINDPSLWNEFEAFYKNLPVRDHPQVRKPSCCKAILLYFVAFILLLLVGYMFFIVL